MGTSTPSGDSDKQILAKKKTPSKPEGSSSPGWLVQKQEKKQKVTEKKTISIIFLFPRPPF
jgi:hypothetical protein